MNDRFKFRVWWEQENRYRIDVKIHPIEKFFRKGFIVEQCTGLKDKNGKLIYEGDKVEITIFGSVGPNGGYVDSDEIYKGTVVWDKDCFLVKTDTDDMILFPHSEDCIEIIGNIHKQAEQKDVK